ncbi:MAG: hypothetical protein NXI04_22965 [Planctomycetaceae bacterium]|nr:hypothetical protein [Planctomycetaceae bacterium]
MDCQLIRENAPQSGEQNMRIDAELLDTVSRDPSCCYVRLYRWSEPTISLGYFQKDAVLEPRWQGCPVVKRLTGGGAILHDQELTYSIALPAVHPFRSEPVTAYERVHQAMIDVLTDLKAPCHMRGDVTAVPREAEPFLCFLRGDPRDVVMGSDKIIGSAQRRRKGAILQHGSLLLRASKLLPEVPGVFDISPGVSEPVLTDRLGDAIRDAITVLPTKNQV